MASAQPSTSGYRQTDTQSSSIQDSGGQFSNQDTLDTPSDENVPPPAYGASYGVIEDDQAGLGSQATTTDDGRVNVRINQKTSRLSSLLVPALRNQLDLSIPEEQPPPYIPPGLDIPVGRRPVPSLNVVIHVVGSRGDVQPFVALGKVLKEKHNHRVRLATHTVFKQFVEENGLEFFDILGDPSELMAFMVKNPGLMPGFDSLRKGDVGHRRKETGKMIQRCWRSCIEAGDGSGIEASDKNIDDWSNQNGSTPINVQPFVADAIIANPPSFAHIHCAEKLGIPLHMMFTMPWSPTQAFPHPLANIKSSNADASMTNFVTYALVEMMTWQGLGDVINRFREKTLGLEPIELTWAPGMLARLKVPYTYCWSPALIPKPRDWGHHISISGFFSLSLANNYTPEPDLAAFLDSGPPPVYIGFGSIVVDDPDGMTKLIFEAIKATGQRCLLSKGWGGFGADEIGVPEGVFMLGNVPHDWLFKRVSCVVHHGGAGTTAAGISCGKPTIVVPFFGDQPFWGAMVARAGAGPQPIPHKKLTATLLTEAINYALKPETVAKAAELAAKISQETGSENGAHLFHEELDINRLRCQLSPNRAAVWKVRKTRLRISAFAATHLANEGVLDFKDLKLYRPREFDTEMSPTDPITGGASAIIATMGGMSMGIADLPVSTLKALKIYPSTSKKNAKNINQNDERESSRSSSRSQSQSNLLKKKSTDVSSSTTSIDRPAETQSASSSRSSSPAPSESSAAIAREAATHFAPGSSSADVSTVPTQSDQESSGPPPFRPQTPPSAIKPTASESTAAPKGTSFEDAKGTLSSFGRIVSSGIKAPMDFSNNMARGFQNAPKLYGDTTVRNPDKITDFASGLKAAGKGFHYGMYDGIAGLVTQPWDGARQEGRVGFMKGFGKGIGGLVLKPGAAMFGLPGYVARGAYKELHKRLGPSVENYIISARVAQGLAEAREASDAEKQVVVDTWRDYNRYLRKDKKATEEMVEDLRARCWKNAHGGTDEDLAHSTTGLHQQYPDPSTSSVNLPSTTYTSRSASADFYSQGDASSHSLPPRSQPTSPPTLPPRAQPYPTHPEPEASSSTSSQLPQRQEKQQDPSAQETDPDMEEAIRRSVADSSRGNAAEDALIEQAIRSSLAELSNRRATKRKPVPSRDSATTAEASAGPSNTTAAANTTAEEPPHSATNPSNPAESATNETDDAEFQATLHRSKTEFEASEAERARADDERRREEETVLRYVMRQSEAEEAFKRGRAGGEGGGSGNG